MTYIVLQSTNESGRITAQQPVRGKVHMDNWGGGRVIIDSDVAHHLAAQPWSMCQSESSLAIVPLRVSLCLLALLPPFRGAAPAAASLLVPAC